MYNAKTIFARSVIIGFAAINKFHLCYYLKNLHYKELYYKVKMTFYFYLPNTQIMGFILME